MNINKTFLIIVLLFSIISCRSNNKINDGFEQVIFYVNASLLSKTPTTIDNIFQITYPLDFNQIEDIDFQKIETAIESDSTSFFQLSLLAIYKSSWGSTSILSKIISEGDVFNEIDTSYLNLLAENFRTNNINIGKIKINGINAIQYLITTKNKVIIKLILNVNNSYYQIDYIIPLEIYEKELKKIESSIGSIIEIKEAHK